MARIPTERVSKHSVESLAKRLSESTQLSFNEQTAFSFFKKTHRTISRIRIAYRELLREISDSAQNTQAVEIFLDNFYIVEGTLSDLRKNWKQKISLRVPQSVGGDGSMYPRTYLVARDFVEETGGRVDKSLIVEFLRSYQKSAPLSVRELEIFPDMLRFVLVEGTLRFIETNITALRQKARADRWYGRIVVAAGRRNAAFHLRKIMALLAAEYAIIPQTFGLHLLHRLDQTEKGGDVRPVDRWLKLLLAKQGASYAQLSANSAHLERTQSDSLTNAIASLRFLTQVRWDKIALELNAVDAVLAKDPSNTFLSLTDDTRSMYRRTIVRIALRIGTHDIEVAREAVRMARQASESRGDATGRSAHVGYYLVDKGVGQLESALGYAPTLVERVQRFILKHSARVYLGFIGAVTIVVSAILFVASGAMTLPPLSFFIMVIAGLILSSEIATVLAHFLFTRVMEPKSLPALNLKEGVGEVHRTLVVMPSMFRNRESAEKLLHRMETNFVANNDAQIYFALLMDFQDAPAETMAGDAERILELEEGITALNARYPSSPARFALFHRARIWNPSEQIFMAWERKRGKLREFNELLRGKKTSYQGNAEEVANKYGTVRYIITLDEDTELVQDSAVALIGTIGHPLNRPVVDTVEKMVTAGYGIIQPRSALRFREGNVSLFSRLFGNFPGVETYSSLVSDLHQDLFGEAIFHGKGIYDIDAVEVTMGERIPENAVLSHDLLEGLYARVGIASGAHIFEGFPSNYREHMQRLHRWIRGDWQIIGWITSFRGVSFSTIGRYRIFDNLRRSVLPVAAAIAVLFSAFSSAAVSVWSVGALLALGSGQLVSALLHVTQRVADWRRNVSLAARLESLLVGIAVALAKTFILATFVFHTAITSADAIFRSVWRMLISKRGLLEWQTAYQSAAERKDTLGSFFRFMYVSVCVSIVLAYFQFSIGGFRDIVAELWILLWVAAPVFATVLSIRQVWRVSLSKKDSLTLRKIAARTHWFFLDLATKEQQWLMPDHLQEYPPSKRYSHGIGISPTNLGMYLLSLSSGRMLGLSSVSSFSERISMAFESIEKMPLYKGHFFNWYNLAELAPLSPRYVSSVDSANLALSFVAVQGALKGACQQPIVDAGVLLSLEAHFSVLSEVCEKATFSQTIGDNERGILEEVLAAVNESLSLLRKTPHDALTPRGCTFVLSGVFHHAVRMRNALETLRTEGKSELFGEVFLAARHTELVIEVYRETVSRYLGHATVSSVSAVADNPVLREVYLKCSSALQRMPSIEELAHESIRKDLEAANFLETVTLSELPSAEKEKATAWYVGVLGNLAESEKQAQITRSVLQDAADKAGGYAKAMDFEFLFNEERGLFHIGYNCSTEKYDEAFYDLLASEANSASIVGIAKHSIPRKHWSHLGRKMVRSGSGRTVVASWAGSLFEYLGTLLYFDVPRGSFWSVSAQRAIAAHRDFAQKLRIPWGMAESASSQMDEGQNYRYQAFGEPSLGFRRDLSESVIVAPYASALALPFVPQEVLRNFAHLIRSGGFGHYGFYDAIDFTHRKKKRTSPGIPARVYFAHHQGYIISSIANVLLGGLVQKMVAADPEMEMVTQLLEEKMPEDIRADTIAVAAPRKVHRQSKAVSLETRRRYLPWRAPEAVSLFLSGGGYSTRITTVGAGQSLYGGISITRDSGDMLRESAGTFFYMYDPSLGETWSPTFMPTKDAGDKHAVSASEQWILFEKTKGDISSSLIITPLPGASGELRELTLTNTGGVVRQISFGVCAELSLAKKEDELAHPNYQHLFVSTETHWGGQAIVASRPLAEDIEKVTVAGFSLVADHTLTDVLPVREKEAFFGSPSNSHNPPILKDFSRANRASPPHTLDSVAAFVGTIRLRPNETRKISFVVVAGDSKDEVLADLKRYRSYKVIRKLVTNADREGSRFLSETGLTAAQAEAYGTIGSLALSRAMNRGDDSELSARPWVSSLWKMGISGARPLVLFSVSGAVDIPVIRQILGCHTYFVRKGILADIIIFNDHSGGYLKTFEDEVDFLLGAQRKGDSKVSSAIYHVRCEHMGEAERSAILSAVSVRIDAKGGSLIDAVLRLSHTPAKKYPRKIEVSKVGKSAVSVLPDWTPSDTLTFFNGIGGYDEKKREYVIRHDQKTHAPRPWSNIVANDKVGFLATDRGMSFTWARNSFDNRLTVSYNDTLSDYSAEALYVRNEETGEYASPLPLSDGSRRWYEVRFGDGYCSYRTHAFGVDIELTMRVGSNEPVKYYEVRLTNKGEKSIALSLIGYFELLMGTMPHDTKKHLSFVTGEGNVLVAQQNYIGHSLGSKAFVGIVGGADEFSVSREEFIGRYGSISHPVALERKGLSSSIESDDEPAAVLLKKIQLGQQESVVVTFFLGECDESDLLSQLKSISTKRGKVSIVDSGKSGEVLLLPKFELPDAELSVLANQFLPYQTITARLRARLGFHQISGAFGYRDQLQDCLAMLWWDSAWVRGHILAAALHQFREGDALSWWQPHNNFGSRTRLSDPHLWLPHVTLRYIRFTGDSSILDEVVPYLSGEIPDMADRLSVTGVFEPSEEKSTVYEHLIRAVEHSLTVGVHGLPLMGQADWNDGMNRVGNEGRGESVWLGWFLVSVLDEMSALSEQRGDESRAARYRTHADNYREALEKAGWDGKWYRRAFTDAGAPVGTARAEGFRIDSITQSWAYFTNGVTEKSMRALQSAKEELVGVDAGLVPLAWPPSSRSSLDLGTISDYPPGVRENAAQYNHAALWLAQALFATGDADVAKTIVDAVNPLKRSATLEGVATYQGEPYVIAAEIYSSPTYSGRAGWTWYTGSSGLLYRTLLEYILGLKREGNTLSFAPSFPSDWHTASVVLPFGKSFYRIHYEISDSKLPVTIALDGAPVPEGVVVLVDDGKTHEIHVTS